MRAWRCFGSTQMRHAFGLFALAALLLSGGCAGSGRTSASDREQLALSVYKDCLDRAARKLDDGMSDAHAAALVVNGACQGPARDFDATFHFGLTPEDSEALLHELSTSESRMRAATDAILRERGAQ